ncbi:MAG TPA: hypothetical protein VIW80_01715 [Pyrinomonadaceae bacterium]
MKNNEVQGSQATITQDLAQRMLEVPKAWQQYLDGKMTAEQFQQTLENLSDVYAAIVAKQREPGEELLWKQYDLHTSLYKHYLEVILKFNVFYYAVTGAILSFYFTKADIPLVRYALLFPILMSIVFGVLFGFATLLNRVTRNDVFMIRDKLNLETAPDLHILSALLALSALLMLAVASLLLWFFFPQLILPAIIITALVCLVLWLSFR